MYEIPQKKIDQLIVDLLNKTSVFSSPDAVLCPLQGAKYIAKTLKNAGFTVGEIPIHTYNNKKQQTSLKVRISSKNLQLIKKSKEIWIWDDIYDTGFTMCILQSLVKTINPSCNVRKIALYRKNHNSGIDSTNDVIVGEKVFDWVKFPWEKTE